MASFGDFIKQEREIQPWVQTRFCANVGINSSAVSRIEHVAKQISPKKLINISKVFQLDFKMSKEICYGDKFGRKVYKNNCSETVFEFAKENL